MMISRERLMAESETTGFRPEILEKVFHLLNLLTVFQRHPVLGNSLVLKGGTALNLFCFNLPRLSVDIDLNYIGEACRAEMLSDREKVEHAVQAVCQREDLAVTRVPGEHAGGKWRLRYGSALGGGGNLEIDLNFMFRILLWPATLMDSVDVGTYSAKGISVMDIHELAAGKLAALFARQASRDLFDVHQLLTTGKLDQKRLRLAFILYGAMNRRDWRTISLDDVGCDPRELENQLLPVLSSKIRESFPPDWAKEMVHTCQEHLISMVDFAPCEEEFLTRLLDHGEIVPGLLTSDAEMAARIQDHPLLRWKALNVKRHQLR
ncbi:MAG TPA: nucleotidyl transferase AbiEii/AbiGii toxin family protein [Candidatus Sabulitectum sp.]|nr:nucleotidyl transferase AbiEii/AbiGii toxin family protein [Candidatus Sabulitectum sp.]